MSKACKSVQNKCVEALKKELIQNKKWAQMKYKAVLAFSCLCVWIPAKTSIIPAPVAALVWGLTRDFRKGSRQKIK
ncbi:UNVERIFIED_CONTAM: hypothetical protein NCL1_13591 [Trichonephila clavipes]